jgi:hypothetical protein
MDQNCDMRYNNVLNTVRYTVDKDCTEYPRIYVFFGTLSLRSDQLSGHELIIVGN